MAKAKRTAPTRTAAIKKAVSTIESNIEVPTMEDLATNLKGHFDETEAPESYYTNAVSLMKMKLAGAQCTTDKDPKAVDKYLKDLFRK